ncbi:hypothetical protein [Labilibaculum antarcticum]|uniref:VWA domain-containing protein n=1 Tax=Labilibaculum antarcticum TaxID=1717717 RepID=A0A1Y1CP96_9BACT|nr:hypothetical protein [Labilibaculum antarcticum]BAX82185.1 hypothetical protein ALGA_3893 [Labilibaculum antarcticum]
MNITIVSEYSLWWVLPFALVSFLLVVWVYFFKRPYHKDLSLPKLYILAFLRGFSILLLLLLILEPKLKYSSEKIEKPLLVFAQDNSKSIGLSSDSLFYLNEYPSEIEKFLESLNSEFEIKKISFGSEVKELSNFDYSETNTNFSDLFEFLKNNYGNSSNVQVVIASDGLYNKGSNPRYDLQDVSFPIHTLQLGDTARIEDVSVMSVKTNELGFVNSKLPVRIGVKATNFDSELVQLKISKGSKILISDEIRIKNNSFYIEKDFFITPEKAGLQKFKVDIIADKNEHSKINNHYEFVVDVLDNQRKIAICFDQYHPDIAAIQSAVNENLNFTVELINLAQKQADLGKYNLVVLYQIPSHLNSYSGFLQQIQQKEIPILMVVGGNSDISAVNKLNLGVTISGNESIFSESSFVGNETFNLFDLKKSNREILEKMPPLLSPLGIYDFSSEHQVIGYQGIKSIQTTNPQIAFTHRDNQKTAWIFGEGVWRWKLHLARMNESPMVFVDLINQVVQYLSLKIDRNQLVVKYAKSVSEGDEIVFDVEMYNKSYELVNQANMDFILTNQEGKSFNYSFEKRSGKYQLKIKALTKGNYSFVAKTQEIENNLEQTGQFIVSSNSTESNNLQADLKMLSQISSLSEGEVFGLSELPEIVKKIRGNEHSQSTLSVETKYGNLIEMLFLLIIIIILMISEWFLRKYWLGI